MSSQVAPDEVRDATPACGTGRNTALAVEFGMALIVSGARRVSLMSSEEMKTVKRLMVAFVDGPESDRPQIVETVLEILLPDDWIGPIGRKVDPPEEVRRRVNESRCYVGRKIRERREELGMTQATLAKKAKIPQSHVSRLEGGKHAPSMGTIERIAKALKVEPVTLDPGYNPRRAA